MLAKHYDWNRYWAPRDGNFSFDTNGFLLPPSEDFKFAKWLKNDSVTFDKIAKTPCLVMLGEPGIGKTTALSQALNTARSAHKKAKLIYRNLGSYSSEQRVIEDVFRSPEFKKWAAKGGELQVFLDSFDECLLRLDNLASLLSDQLSRLATIAGLSFRITSRTAEWRTSLEDTFSQKWPQDADIGVYELSPLTEEQVRLAVKANDCDDDAFIKEVIHREVVSFAIKPLTLELLIKVWEKHGGVLPPTQAEIYEAGCLELCSETNPDRQTPLLAPKVLPEQRLAIAGHIAAGMVFSKRAAVWQGRLPSGRIETDISMSELTYGSVAVAGQDLPITLANLKETLNSGLFNARGKDRMGWAHQTYAEFLAARWVRNQKLTVKQTEDLLFHPLDEEHRVIPQLQEVASWIAADQKSFFSRLLSTEPDILLRSDVAGSNPDTKKNLVAGLLKSVSKLSWVGDWAGLRNRYRKLRYPDLARQLRIGLLRAKGSRTERIEIIYMLQSCEISLLNDDLVKIALNTKEDMQVRITAADFISKRGTTSEKKRLLPLAIGKRGANTHDELKAAGLRACWPELLPAQTLFQHLTPEQHNVTSRYSLFLDGPLAAGLTAQDIPLALSWATAQPGPPFPPRRAYRDLVHNIILKAFDFADSPAILSELAKTILTRSRAHDFCMGHETKPLETILAAKPELRLNVASAMFPHFADFDADAMHMCHWGVCWVRSTDMDWLLNQLATTTSPETQKAIAHVIGRLFQPVDPTVIDTIFEATEKNAPLRAALGYWLGYVDLRSDSAKKQREAFAEHKQWTAVTASRRQQKVLVPSPTEHILALLDQSENGDASAWWKLCTWLGVDNFGYDSNSFGIEYTDKVEWQSAPLEIQVRMVQAASRYIATNDPQEKEWLPKKNIVNRPARAGLMALLLLADESAVEFRNLTPEIWSKWSPTILGFPLIGDHKRFQMLTQEVLNKVPDGAATWILKIVRIENQKDGHLSVLNKIPDPLPESIGKKLVTEFKKLNLALPCKTQLLTELVNRNAPSAIALLKTFIPARPPKKGDLRTLALQSSRLLLLKGEPGDWPRLWQIIERDTKFGQGLFEGFRSEYDTRPAPILQMLTEEDIARLWKWMQAQYPFKSDPPLNDDGAVSTRWSMARLRDGLVTHLADLGTAEASNQLRILSIKYKKQVPWLSDLLIRAQDQFRRKSWSPPEPSILFQLGQSSKFRFVESGAQLQEIVLDALAQIQLELNGEVPSAPDLWNSDRPKSEEQFSDWLKRHLENHLKGRGVILNREVRIHISKRTDIHIDAVSVDKNSKPVHTLKVIIEVKGCWNPEVKTGMRAQLRDDYLANNDCNHGIFLVGWFVCDAWSRRDGRRKQVRFKQVKKLRTFLSGQVTKYSGNGKTLAAVVLEALIPSKPKATRKRSKAVKKPRKR